MSISEHLKRIGEERLETVTITKKEFERYEVLLEACREALKCLENPPTDNTYCINQLSQAIDKAEGR